MIDTETAAQSYIAENWGSKASADCALLLDALRDENTRQNLVSRGSLDRAWTRHIADSAQLIGHAGDPCNTWLDIGSGAGFPGLVVAILRRDTAVTLVEPRRLRVEWLERMRRALELANCSVVLSKVEDLPTRRFDAISARAVAKIADLLSLTDRFGGDSSRWIFAKGRSALAEVAAVPKAQAGRYLFHVKHSLTADEARIIVAQRANDRD